MHPLESDLDTATRWHSTGDLAAEGWSERQIAGAVRTGLLRRVRRGAYVDSVADDRCVAAASLRGRLSCVSELRRRGVFVRDGSKPHIHIPAYASRLPAAPDGVKVHRRRLVREPHPRSMSVDAFDAVVQAVLCQEPRAAIATLDSALHLGVLHHDDLDELFAALPRRHRRLRALLDPRAESGPETLARLMLRALGCRFVTQVAIDGVGRVDFLVDGWLIVECDSEAFHSSWTAQQNDRRRDLAAAARGFAVLRLLAADIMWRPDEVLAAMRGVLYRSPRVARAGRIAT